MTMLATSRGACLRKAQKINRTLVGDAHSSQIHPSAGTSGTPKSSISNCSIGRSISFLLRNSRAGAHTRYAPERAAGSSFFQDFLAGLERNMAVDRVSEPKKAPCKENVKSGSLCVNVTNLKSYNLEFFLFNYSEDIVQLVTSYYKSSLSSQVTSESTSSLNYPHSNARAQRDHEAPRGMPSLGVSSLDFPALASARPGFFRGVMA